jgi:hypothetical protein
MLLAAVVVVEEYNEVEFEGYLKQEKPDNFNDVDSGRELRMI